MPSSHKKEPEGTKIFSFGGFGAGESFFRGKKSEAAVAVVAKFFGGGPEKSVVGQSDLLSLELCERVRRIFFFCYMRDNPKPQILIEIDQVAIESAVEVGRKTDSVGNMIIAGFRKRNNVTGIEELCAVGRGNLQTRNCAGIAVDVQHILAEDRMSPID